MGNEKAFGRLFIALILVFLVLTAGYYAIDYINPETVSGTVANNYLVRYVSVGEWDHFYNIVQYDDGRIEIFRNEDLLWSRIKDSTIIDIKTDQQYLFEVRGIYCPSIGKFRKIISAIPK